MSELANELMKLLKHISSRPIMHGVTPEAAHGLFEGLAAVYVQQVKGVSLREGFKEVMQLIYAVTGDVYDDPNIYRMLCEDPRIEKKSRVTSFDTFRTRSGKFIELLEAKFKSS